MKRDTRLRLKIGEGIYKERERNGLTQFHLAEESGLHVNYIGQVERGQKDITVQALTKICNVYGISLSNFFEAINL